MFNMDEKINKFYNEYVRLKDERKELAGYRDTNLERLRSGLDKLDFPLFYKNVDQGSYAMFTINQHPDKAYDIDEGIIFKKEDLPSNSLDARKRIEAAMREGGGNFSKPPEVKTNAVRVYYAEGFHVDLAIYRTYTDMFGNVICEHAGSDWTPRDPMEITNWFNDSVIRLSPPKGISTVSENQMRRIVRWLKAFTKSRENWELPSGLIISVLAEECYQPNFDRDDISLYETMSSILTRLKFNKEVLTPVDPSQSLTERPVDQGRVRRLLEKLEQAIDKLSILHQSSCTENDATEAWHWFFQHPFWGTEEKKESFDEMGRRFGQAAVGGNIYVAQNGHVNISKPVIPSINSPTQNFFGED